MIESFPGFIFHIPKAIRKTETTSMIVVKLIMANGTWKLELNSGAKFNGLSSCDGMIFSQLLVVLQYVNLSSRIQAYHFVLMIR